MEKSSWIQLPRTVLIGSDALDRVDAVVNDIHLNGDPLIVTTTTPRTLVGDKIAEQFRVDGRSPDFVTITGTGFDAVQTVIDTAEQVGADFLVGVGGGKPIDVTKAASNDLGVGFISIPTAASHDGIVSGRSSIPEGDTRYSVSAEPPLAVVADTSVLADAPWQFTTAGYADIISNYTATRDWDFARRLHNVEYSNYAATLANMTAELLVSNKDAVRPESEYGVWLVAKALLSSGVSMSIAGSSRPASGAEHMFSHQLDRIADDSALHGHQVGVGTILTAYLQGDTESVGWKDVRSALETVGAPTTADDLGISDDTIIEALTTAHKIRDRYTILGDNGISRDAAIEACDETDVL